MREEVPVMRKRSERSESGRIRRKSGGSLRFILPVVLFSETNRPKESRGFLSRPESLEFLGETNERERE